MFADFSSFASFSDDIFYIHSWCFKCLAIQIMEYYLETPYPHVAFRDTIIYTTAELTSYSNMNVTRNDNDALLVKQLVLAALFTVTCIGWQKKMLQTICIIQYNYLLFNLLYSERCNIHLHRKRKIYNFAQK